MDFVKEFERTQAQIRHTKMYYTVKRAMNIQARNKIKPSSMNPVLLNSPTQGGAKVTDAPLDLYYPS
jgi:hypothetical protein